MVERKRYRVRFKRTPRNPNHDPSSEMPTSNRFIRIHLYTTKLYDRVVVGGLSEDYHRFGRSIVTLRDAIETKPQLVRFFQVAYPSLPQNYQQSILSLLEHPENTTTSFRSWMASEGFKRHVKDSIYRETQRLYQEAWESTPALQPFQVSPLLIDKCIQGINTEYPPYAVLLEALEQATVRQFITDYLLPPNQMRAQ